MGRRYRATAPRLTAALLLCALLAIPLSAGADDSGSTSASDLPSVSIEIPRAALPTPNSWTKSPVIAQLVPQGAGAIWYRFGAGPGPWQRSYGYVVVPPGKQTLSAVLVNANGTTGPVNQLVIRSDAHASSAGETMRTAAPMSVASAASTDGAGTAVEGAATVRVVVGPKQYGTVIRRLQGPNRYATGAAISSSAFKTSNTVIIATGENFPDALTASGLAGTIKAPVLLVHRTSLPAETKAEIRRLKAKHAIICGSSRAVDNYTAGRIKALGLSVERLQGKTRYETAIEVSKRIQRLTGRNDRVFIARGDKFPDALIVAPMAYATRSPILLTTRATIWPTTARRLSTGRYKTPVVVGGFSPATLNSIKNRTGTYPEVWSGNGPSDTSVQVAAQEVLEGVLSWKYVGMARSDIFPDALCGGVLVGKMGGVILLTPPKTLDAGVANALEAHTADIARCDVFGSRYAISDGVYAQIRAIFQ